MYSPSIFSRKKVPAEVVLVDEGVADRQLVVLGGEGAHHRGQVRLGVQVDEEDLLPHPGPRLSDGDGSGRLSDTALVVGEANSVSHFCKSIVYANLYKNIFLSKYKSIKSKHSARKPGQGLLWNPNPDI